jgi:hypothetical protein
MASCPPASMIRQQVMSFLKANIPSSFSFPLTRRLAFLGSGPINLLRRRGLL